MAEQMREHRRECDGGNAERHHDPEQPAVHLHVMRGIVPCVMVVTAVVMACVMGSTTTTPICSAGIRVLHSGNGPRCTREDVADTKVCSAGRAAVNSWVNFVVLPTYPVMKSVSIAELRTRRASLDVRSTACAAHRPLAPEEG